MKSLLYHGFGIKGYRHLRTRYEKGEIIFEIEPDKPPVVPEGQGLIGRGCRWRKVRTLSIGMKGVWLRVKIPRWLNTTTGEDFEQSPPLPSRIERSRERSRG